MSNDAADINSTQITETSSAKQQGIFHETRIRLEEIAETVQGEGVELDEMLALFEEAVNLGASAVAQVEDDIDTDSTHCDVPAAIEAGLEGEQGTTAQDAAQAPEQPAIQAQVQHQVQAQPSPDLNE